MIYEGTVQFLEVDKKGNDKTIKESVILDDFETFTEVEAKMYSEYDGRTDLDIIAIKRSLIKEIANIRENDNQQIFVAVVTHTITKDNGDEKEISYKIAFFADGIDKAKSFIDNYIKQGYNMKLTGLTETKFVDVLC